MGTNYNCLVEAVLTSTHNLCFEQTYKKYQNFLSENFHFLVVKFSVYLNRRVFVMLCGVCCRSYKECYTEYVLVFSTFDDGNI